MRHLAANISSPKVRKYVKYMTAIYRENGHRVTKSEGPSVAREFFLFYKNLGEKIDSSTKNFGPTVGNIYMNVLFFFCIDNMKT